MKRFLIKIDNSIVLRYETLLRNIKSKSNSFYDSYLDLLESTIKYVLDRENISYDETRTCGYIIQQEAVIKAFKETIGVDDYTYSKFKDYTKKVNDHKHKKEKWVSIEAVINYLKVYYDFIGYYFKYLKLDEIPVFDADYYVSIFGISEKLNKEYKEEVSRLKDELIESVNQNKLSETDIKKYKNLISLKDIELMSLDDQNQKLMEEINALKDIKLNSMETKLNKTIELLNSMQDYLTENRAISKGIGYMICGPELIDNYIDKAREDMKK